MIELNKDLRSWIKYSLKAIDKSRKEIADEIGISFDYLARMTTKKPVSANAVIKVLKYLNYPDLDKLRLEEKKIYGVYKEPVHNRRFAECIKKYGLSLSDAGKICGVSRQRIFSIVKEERYLTEDSCARMIDSITEEMESRAGQQK